MESKSAGNRQGVEPGDTTETQRELGARRRKWGVQRQREGGGTQTQKNGRKVGGAGLTQPDRRSGRVKQSPTGGSQSGADTHPDGREVLRQTDGREPREEGPRGQKEGRRRVQALRDRTTGKSAPSQTASVRARGPSRRRKRRRQVPEAAGAPCPSPAHSRLSPAANGRHPTCRRAFPPPRPTPTRGRHAPSRRVGRPLPATRLAPSNSPRLPGSSAFFFSRPSLPTPSSPSSFLRPRRRRLCQPPCAAQRAIPRPHHPRRSAPASPGGHVTAPAEKTARAQARAERGGAR